MVIIADTYLHQLMYIVVQENELKGLYLNCTMSFTMVFSKSTTIPAYNITVHGKRIDQVNTFI